MAKLTRRRPPPQAAGAWMDLDGFTAALDTLRGAGAAGTLSDDVLADIAQRAWQAGRVLSRDRPGGPTPAEVTMLRRFAAAILDSLEQADVQVHDLAGQRYVDNMAVEVSEWREEPGLAHETIVETDAPLIKRGDRRLRRARVVVGEPPRKGGDIAL